MVREEIQKKKSVTTTMCKIVLKFEMKIRPDSTRGYKRIEERRFGNSSLVDHGKILKIGI